MFGRVPISRGGHFPPFTPEMRRQLAEQLAAILPALDVLDAETVSEVADMLLAALRSPAPLDWRAVLPLMAELSERAAACFDRGAEEFAGAPLGSELRRAAAGAQQDAQWLRRAIARDGRRAG